MTTTHDNLLIIIQVSHVEMYLRFLLGFFVGMSRAKPDPSKMPSSKQRTVAYFGQDFRFGLSLG